MRGVSICTGYVSTWLSYRWAIEFVGKPTMRCGMSAITPVDVVCNRGMAAEMCWECRHCWQKRFDDPEEKKPKNTVVSSNNLSNDKYPFSSEAASSFSLIGWSRSFWLGLHRYWYSEFDDSSMRFDQNFEIEQYQLRLNTWVSTKLIIEYTDSVEWIFKTSFSCIYHWSNCQFSPTQGEIIRIHEAWYSHYVGNVCIYITNIHTRLPSPTFCIFLFLFKRWIWLDRKIYFVNDFLEILKES